MPELVFIEAYVSGKSPQEFLDRNPEWDVIVAGPTHHPYDGWDMLIAREDVEDGFFGMPRRVGRCEFVPVSINAISDVVRAFTEQSERHRKCGDRHEWTH